MKSVLQLLKMDHKHMEHQLCHPRREASFDHTAIERKIDEIKERKQRLRQEAQEKQKQMEAKIEQYQENPLMQLFDNSLDPLSEQQSLMLKQKMKFIEQKVYIGTKNNVNQEYITRVNDANQAPGPLKDELNLFMEDIMSNLETDIIDGTYEIYSKKDTLIPKGSIDQSGNLQNPTKLIQLKKVELAGKIDELREELTQTEQQHSKLTNSNLSYQVAKNRSYSLRDVPSHSLNNSAMHSSINIEDFNLKSEKTKQAEQFVKRFQKEQEQKRIRRLKKQQQAHKLEAQSLQEKSQFQHRIKEERHEKLKRKFEEEKQHKQSQRNKSLKAKEDYEKFLQEYKKRVPLFKQKDIKFKKKLQKYQKQRASLVFSEIKQSKRSIDINEIKEHEKKYKGVRKQFQNQKLANLKHRQKEIQLRHKQDRLYFRGRYHSMIKQEEERVPEDPALKRDQLLKRKKQFADKVKKQFVPHTDQSKQKELDELILKINRNKPTRQVKDSIEIGNKYLGDLHKLVTEIKEQGRVKVDLPEEIQPRYRDYLQDIRRQRQNKTISYLGKSEEWLEEEAFRSDRNIKQRQRVIRAKLQGDGANDVFGQLKQIDQLDMELLKAVKLKANLLNKVDPLSDQQQDESEY